MPNLHSARLPPPPAVPARRLALARLLGAAAMLPSLSSPARAKPTAETTRVLPVGGPGGLTLAQALRAARPGDTLEVQADLHGEVGVVEQPGLTLRGAGGRRILWADGQSAEGKAIIVVRAPDTVLDQLEFRGARVPSDNGAGIRFETGTLQVRRCVFFDNENGLLAANRRDMRLQVADCEFSAAPRHAGLLHHLLYVGAIGHFELSGSRFSQGYRGHLVKSRALVNHVWCNWLDDGPAGQASYEFELPNGGQALLLGNLIGQSAESDNPVLVSIGAEARPDAVRTAVVLAHNTLVNHGTWRGRFIDFWGDRLGAAATLRVVNNVWAGPGNPGHDSAQDGGGNLRVDLSELAAAARGDYRLGASAVARAHAVAMAPVDGQALLPLREFSPSLGTHAVAMGAQGWLPGALQGRR